MDKSSTKKSNQRISDVRRAEDTNGDSSSRDIKPEVAEIIAAEEKEMSPLKLDRRRAFPGGIIWGILALVLIFIVSFGYLLYGAASSHFSKSITKNLNQFQAGVEDLKKLDSKSAEQKFSAVNDDIGLTFGGVVEKIRPFFESTNNLLLGFRNLSEQGVVLSQEVGFLQNNAIPFALGQKGEELITHLEKVQKALKDVKTESDKLSVGVSGLKVISPEAADFYIPLRLDVGRLESSLGAFLVWLKSDSPRHMLLMFQNPSEIRPAGGFLGSYADVTVNKASLGNIDVHDVNDADRGLDSKIVPPKPLQSLVTNLRAADANWFFDFSKSAALVIKLIEASKVYRNSSTTTFDGAVAVSPKVIGDILSLTGPLKLKDGSVLNDKNFLVETQKKVQLSQAQRATYPKGVLREISSAVLQRLVLLDAPTRQKLLGLIQDWIAKKNLVFYFKDLELQKFLESLSAAGKIYEEPTDFEGDYLAIVDANIGGGKSDLFMKQNVALESQINMNGIVTNHLVITREHQGGKSRYWWYKVTNQDYLQIFTPKASQLANFKGGIEKNILPPINYSKNGYAADPLIKEIESSGEKIFSYPALSVHNESDKKVFSTWVRVGAGEKKQIIFDYSHRLFSQPEEGTVYQFIFEKQAGSDRHYTFEISAPVGFKFRESGTPVFEYSTDDPPGRLMLNLTLQKI